MTNEEYAYMDAADRQVYADEMATDMELAEYAAEINALSKQTARAILRIGTLLIEARNRVMYGRWGEWLEREVSYSQATANRFMAAAERFGEMENVQELPISKVYELLRAPEEALGELADAAADLSVRQLRDEIDKVRSEHESRIKGLQRELEEVTRENTSMADCIGEFEEDMCKLRSAMGGKKAALEALKKEKENAERRSAEALTELERVQAELEEARAATEVTEMMVVAPDDYEETKQRLAAAEQALKQAREAEANANAQAAEAKRRLEETQRRIELPVKPEAMRAVRGEELQAAVTALCTDMAAMPYMGKRYRSMPQAMRAPYRAALEQLQVFVTAAMAAVDGVDLEVQEA